MSNIAHKARDVKRYPLTTDTEQSKEPTRLHPRDQRNFLDRYEWAASLGYPTFPRMMLVALVYRDGSGKGCWASQGTLAGDTGMSVASAKTHLKFLLGQDVIERDKELVGPDGGRATVMYRPVYPFGRNVSKLATTSSQDSRQVGIKQLRGSQQLATNPEGNHEEKPEPSGDAREAVSQNETKDAGDGADKPRGKGLCPTCGGLRWVKDLELGFGMNKCPSCTGSAELATRKGTPTNGADKPQREPDLGTEDCKACRGSGEVIMEVELSAANVACPKCRPAAYSQWKQNRRNKPRKVDNYTGYASTGSSN